MGESGDKAENSFSGFIPLSDSELNVRAQNFESTENIRVFWGFLRAKGVFLEKNDGDRVVFPVFGKTLFCGNCLSWGLLRAC